MRHEEKARQAKEGIRKKVTRKSGDERIELSREDRLSHQEICVDQSIILKEKAEQQNATTILSFVSILPFE